MPRGLADGFATPEPMVPHACELASAAFSSHSAERRRLSRSGTEALFELYLGSVSEVCRE